MGHGEQDLKAQVHVETPIRVLQKFCVSIPEGDKRRLEGIAKALARDEPALAALDAFGPGARCGMVDGPMLMIGNHTDIPLVSEESGELYQYRMALLARDGDLVALNVRRNQAFEDYLSGTLRLGRPQYLTVAANASRRSSPLARTCIEDQSTFVRIVAAARSKGCLTIVPHIGTGHPWLLASAVARAADCPVHVAAPPPRLTKRANDKLWFSVLVRKTLGRHAEPESSHVYGPASLVGRLRLLATKHDRLVVKVPDSAGSAGNIALQACDIRGNANRAVLRHVLELLRATGWTDKYPLQAQVWDCSVRATPSVQLWLPRHDEGAPVIEGIYEQVVEGPEGEFVGSRPTELPPRLINAVAEEAHKLAFVLQACGYFGRCSFDAVIAGDDEGAGSIHWIECNGRWGGVSLPMTLVNRLALPEESPELVVVQRAADATARPHTRTVLEALRNHLFVPSARREGIILLSPPADGGGSRLHFAAVGRQPGTAMAYAREAIEAVSSVFQSGAGGHSVRGQV